MLSRLTCVVTQYGTGTEQVSADSSDTDTVVGTRCQQVTYCQRHTDIVTVDDAEVDGLVVNFYDVLVNYTRLFP